MNVQAVITASLGGMLAGGYFFGGLWWTVRRAIKSDRPGTLFLSSSILRYGLVLAVFYNIFVSGDYLTRIVPCLLGFVISREIVKWVTGRLAPDLIAKEGGPTCI